MFHEWRHGEYIISTDKERLDLSVIHNFLTTSYWAAGIPLETVQRSLEHALAFGVYKEDQLVGFARVITDYQPLRTLEMCSCWRRFVGKDWANG